MTANLSVIDGTRILDFTEGENCMTWAEYSRGVWTKVHAVVAGNVYLIRHGVWVKKGRGNNNHKDILEKLEDDARTYIANTFYS